MAECWLGKQNTMRAIVATAYGPPEVLEACDLPRPIPTQNQMLVLVAACGVCGHDRHARRGDFPLSKPPFVMGHEIAGTVVEVGAAVTSFRVGDRVAMTQRLSCGSCPVCLAGRDNVCVSGVGFYGEGPSGGYGDFVIASPRNAVRVPADLPFDVAAVSGCAIGTGFHALRRSALGIGETVVITAAGGGVGINALALAQLMGLNVIAVTTSVEKAPALTAAGADHVIAAKSGEFHEQVRELTHGAGADGVIEIAGSPTFKSSVRSIRAGGRMVLVGNVQPGAVPLNPAIAILKEIDFVGSGHATRADLARVLDLVAAGKIAPIISERLPRDRAMEAHRILDARANKGRVVLIHEAA